jgi:hypothetical protein
MPLTILEGEGRFHITDRKTAQGTTWVAALDPVPVPLL